jgi:hypothetical protein
MPKIEAVHFIIKDSASRGAHAMHALALRERHHDFKDFRSFQSF